MPFYEPRLAPLPSCYVSEECPRAPGRLKHCHSFPGYITFSMSNACRDACTSDESRLTSDEQEELLGSPCPDPLPQVWPDTDDELDLGVNAASSKNNEPQALEGGNGGWAISDNLGSWADVEDEADIELDAASSDNSGLNLASPELFPNPWPKLKANAGLGDAEGAVDEHSDPKADVQNKPWDVQTPTRAPPLLINLECALPSPFEQQGTTSLHAQSCQLSSWLPYSPKHAVAGIDTPQSCASASLQSTAATPMSCATSFKGVLSESEATTPHSQSEVASFTMQGNASWHSPSFGLPESPLCLSTSSPTRVPAAVGPHKCTAKKPANAAATSPSGHMVAPAMRSKMKEGKAVGALALKKARAMLPAVNPKPVGAIAKPEECPLLSSPLSGIEGLAKSATSTTDGLQAAKRPFPTLLQGRGMMKAGLTSRHEKSAEFGIAR